MKKPLSPALVSIFVIEIIGLLLVVASLAAQTIRPTFISQIQWTELTTAQEAGMTLGEGSFWYNTTLNCYRYRSASTTYCIGGAEANPSRWNGIRVVTADGEFTTIQAAIDDDSTDYTVLVTTDQTLTSTLDMRSGIRLVCISRDIVITQANSTDLVHLINFQNPVTSNASIENCTIDGNRANNTTGTSLVSLFTGSNNKIRYNIFQNGLGAGILMGAGTGNDVSHNDFDAIASINVQIQAAAIAVTSATVSHNYFTRWGSATIRAIRGSGNEIIGNHGDGTQVISVVDTSGTTITHVSGTNFATLLSGMFVNIGNTESVINSVDSSTQLTVAVDFGSQSSVAMISGSGDGITINTGSDNLVAFNQIRNSMANGFVVHNTDASGATAHNRLIGNHALHNGDAGIWVRDVAGGSITIDSTLLASNTLIENGIGGHTNFETGIRLSGSEVENTAIDGNLFRDSQGTPTQTIAMALDSAGTGTAVGVNYVVGAMTPFRNYSNVDTSGISGALTAHGELIVNEAGLDLDSRIEGLNDINLLYVDAGNDRVGIGTSTPSVLFDIDGEGKAITFSTTGVNTNALKNPLEGTLSNVPRWIFKQVDFGDMTAAATADTFTLWTLPANTMIHDVVGLVNTGWSGGSISAAVASVGTQAGSDNDLALDDTFFGGSGTRFELHDATANGGKGTLLYDGTDKFAPFMFVAGGVIEFQMDLTGDDHANATAGRARIYMLVSQPLGNTTAEAN